MRRHVSDVHSITLQLYYMYIGIWTNAPVLLLSLDTHVYLYTNSLDAWVSLPPNAADWYLCLSVSFDLLLFFTRSRARFYLYLSICPLIFFGFVRIVVNSQIGISDGLYYNVCVINRYILHFDLKNIIVLPSHSAVNEYEDDWWIYTLITEIRTNFTLASSPFPLCSRLISLALISVGATLSLLHSIDICVYRIQLSQSYKRQAEGIYIYIYIGSPACSRVDHSLQSRARACRGPISSLGSFLSLSLSLGSISRRICAFNEYWCLAPYIIEWPSSSRTELYNTDFSHYYTWVFYTPFSCRLYIYYILIVHFFVSMLSLSNSKTRFINQSFYKSDLLTVGVYIPLLSREFENFETFQSKQQNNN